MHYHRLLSLFLLALTLAAPQSGFAFLSPASDAFSPNAPSSITPFSGGGSTSGGGPPFVADSSGLGSLKSVLEPGFSLGSNGGSSTGGSSRGGSTTGGSSSGGSTTGGPSSGDSSYTPASSTGSYGGGAIGDLLCQVVYWFLGSLGQGIATLSVIVLGIGALMGKVSQGTALTTMVGISVIFGAPNIVQELTGQSACYSSYGGGGGGISIGGNAGFNIGGSRINIGF